MFIQDAVRESEKRYEMILREKNEITVKCDNFGRENEQLQRRV